GPDAADVDLDTGTEPVDLRLVPAAAGSWLGIVAGLHGSPATAVAVTVPAGLIALAVAGAARTTPARLAAGVALVALLSGLAVGAVRAWALHAGPVAALAEEGASVQIDGVVTTQPGVHSSRGESYVT